MVSVSSRPDYRGQADKYPSVVAPPLLRAKIEIKLFPEHRLIVLSVYSTQGWALMRLTVIWRNILQPSSVRRAAGPGLLMPVWAAEEAESLLLSFQMTLLCPCRSGNMKCHRVLCACLKMSEIQQLVTHGSARGWWDIKGDSKTILLKITKTILQRVLGGADISGFQKALSGTKSIWNKNSPTAITFFVPKPKMQMAKQLCYFRVQHSSLCSVSVGSLHWLAGQVLSIVKCNIFCH